MKAAKLLRGLALGALASVLCGCAGPPVVEDWLARPTHKPLPARLVQIAERDLPRTCNIHVPNAILYGCAIRVLAAGECLIYTGPKPAQWLIDHEKKHCAGWEHSDPRNAALHKGN